MEPQNLSQSYKKKTLLTADELISHLKKKGITFKYISEESARSFLEEHNYFFKLYAYRANYEKITKGAKKGQYIHLDFSFLQELSTLDCHLRYLIVEMCLTLEHALKVMLIKDIEANPDEDGYSVVSKWNKRVQNGKTRIQNIESQAKSGYCRDLIRKNHGHDYPIWVICEIISFGDLCKLIQTYDKMYPNRLHFNPTLVFQVKNLRNAAAHSNCLINNLRQNMITSKSSQGSVISKEVSRIHQISKRTRIDCLSNQQVYDFTALLYLFFRVVQSTAIKQITYKNLLNLFIHRMRKRKRYFRDNALIYGRYRFIIYVIRNICRPRY